MFRADDRVFDAMLDGWRAQMLARGLTAATIQGRCRLVRRFQEFTGEFPWQWRPVDIEEFLAERRSGDRQISLTFPATRWPGPTRVIDAEGRWEQARRLLHDDALKPGDRVAGLLVLLYAQQPAAISRLTVDHVQASDGVVRLRLGREPLVVPEPLATLVLHLVVTRQGHATTGDQGTSRWLLPGGRPGQPVSPYRLSERLHQVGIQPGPARSTALFQLATELPAAILARMLGIHIDVAVAWQRASAGDWMTYAADVSRRTAKDNRP